MGRMTDRRPVLRVDAGHAVRRPDTLAVEEPLEIRVNGVALAVTMRTPGDDVDLAIGFLLTEGLIRHGDDVTTARFCDGADEAGTNSYNVLDLTLASDAAQPDPIGRQFYTTSSCGICGKASIETVRTVSSYDVGGDPVRIPTTVLIGLPEKLRDRQRAFDRTGGVHAAALFDAGGDLLCVREDVGRHNAVDKLVGWAAREGRLPLVGTVLQVSGRASFELGQKAVMAGVPVLSAISAPSSLAVDLAVETGMTLVGFLRGSSFTIYAGESRIVLDGEPIDDLAMGVADPTSTP